MCVYQLTIKTNQNDFKKNFRLVTFIENLLNNIDFEHARKQLVSIFAT